MNVSFQGRGLTGRNDWKSPACVTREKSDLFTKRLSFDLLIKHYEVIKKKEERNKHK